MHLQVQQVGHRLRWNERFVPILDDVLGIFDDENRVRVFHEEGEECGRRDLFGHVRWNVDECFIGDLLDEVSNVVRFSYSVEKRRDYDGRKGKGDVT